MNRNISFQDAERKQSKASIVIQGLSGLGKSGLALAIARALADWDKIFVCDTESGSTDLFEGIQLSTGQEVGKFKKFDLTEEDGFAPSNYLEVREAAKQAGAEVFIQDSATQSWAGPGGVLDIVSHVKLDTNNKSMSVWNDDKVVAEKNILNSATMWRDKEVHVISTVRMKEKVGFTEDNKVVKLGEQPIQSDQVKYEPDLIITMVKAGTPQGDAPVGVIEKSRYAILRVGNEYAFTEELCKQIGDYLNEGVSVEELEARQKNDMVVSITDILKADKSLQVQLAMFKKTQGISADSKLADMDLKQLQSLYKLLYR